MPSAAVAARKHVGFDQDRFPLQGQGEEFKGAVHGLADVVIGGGMEQDSRHFEPLYRAGRARR